MIRLYASHLSCFQIRKTSKTGRSEFSDSGLAVWWPTPLWILITDDTAITRQRSVADREVCGEVDGLAAIARTQELLVERSSA